MIVFIAVGIVALVVSGMIAAFVLHNKQMRESWSNTMEYDQSGNPIERSCGCKHGAKGTSLSKSHPSSSISL